MRNIIFVSGIGTGIGKTLVSAILAEALEADFWKPVQAGDINGTDSARVKSLLTNSKSIIHPEAFLLKTPASPHIAARIDGVELTIKKICAYIPDNNRNLIVEGAGGLLVPLNDAELVPGLIVALNAKVVMVSRNYLGSINHSLMTARVAEQLCLPVIGWVFNDQFMDYEAEIVRWSNLPRLASIPFHENPGRAFVRQQAELMQEHLKGLLC